MPPAGGGLRSVPSQAFPDFKVIFSVQDAKSKASWTHYGDARVQSFSWFLRVCGLQLSFVSRVPNRYSYILKHTSVEQRSTHKNSNP